LWVGTYNGLARFDGSRFVVFDPMNCPSLGHSRVQGLYVDATGTLWINTFRGGLTSYRNGVFQTEWPDTGSFDLHTMLARSTAESVTFVTQYGDVLIRKTASTNWLSVAPPAGTRPMFQCADAGGTLWFLSREGNILRMAGGRFAELSNNGGLGTNRIFTLVADPSGNVWAGAENFLGRWNGSSFVDMTPTNADGAIEPQLLLPTRSGAVWVLDGERLRKMVNRRWVLEVSEWRGLLGRASGRAMGAHEDRAGGIWFNHYGNGLFHITTAEKFERFTVRDGLAGDRVGAWYQTTDGGVWAGVDHGGLTRLHDRKFHVIGPADGLPVRTILSVCEDANHVKWIGTAGGGLCRLQDGAITRFPVAGSASANFIFAVVPKADGGLWLSAGEGEELYEFYGRKIVKSVPEVHGIKTILTAPNGVVWAGTKTGIAWWTATQRGVFATDDNGTLPSFRALTCTPDGQVWAGADDGTLYQCHTNGLTAFRPKDTLADEPIVSLYSDSDGVIWAGTSRGGLLRFEKGVFSRITAKQGLPVDIISQIMEDDHDRLWLGTHQGIYCVYKTELETVAHNATNALSYVVYGRHDGLPTLECSDGYQPA